ncbi:hypothetical protein NL676_030331 [Syzygium grande]|nr:hypothetical protein NL676_030331 [Syzygium grande]
MVVVVILKFQATARLTVFESFEPCWPALSALLADYIRDRFLTLLDNRPPAVEVRGLDVVSLAVVGVVSARA